MPLHRPPQSFDDVRTHVHAAFLPHPLLRGGHRQTMVGNLWRPQSIPYQARQHLVALRDGDTIVLHDDCPQGWTAAGRIALLIHGLGGCHRSGYMERLAVKLSAAGIRTFRMDLRGCGAGVGLASRTAHAGRSEDVAAALSGLYQMFPRAALAVCGFSLGGAILLKTLADDGARGHVQLPRTLRTAIAVSPPIDLWTCIQALRRVPNRVYDWYFSRLLWKRFRAQRAYLANLGRARLDRRPRSLFEFDDRITAPLGGFGSARDYYQEVRVQGLLSSIQVPLRILIAADDPLIPMPMFAEEKLPSSAQLIVCRHGGHMGFLGRSATASRHFAHRDLDARWMEWRIVEWIEDLKPPLPA